ncbi:MAG TPA: hypothetical protein VLJ21_04220 [Candidatus Binatia bacterium]|nr:hypothetical protein [Candidatus Binatia bacterium]
MTLVDLLPAINGILSLILIVSSIALFWHIRGGLWARAMMPVIASWMLLSFIAIVEVFDSGPQVEALSDFIRFLRLGLHLLAVYAFWRIFRTQSVTLVVKNKR